MAAEMSGEAGEEKMTCATWSSEAPKTQTCTVETPLGGRDTSRGGAPSTQAFAVGSIRPSSRRVIWPGGLLPASVGSTTVTSMPEATGEAESSAMEDSED